MINQIEELLLSKTENKRSRIFYTQWQLAKEYVPQVLNLISHTFPHYSLHDQTHSETIINNISRIIGKETLDKLSAIDLWLLISAAYYHDLGMAVFAVDKIEIFNSEGFVEFIINTQEDAHSPLNEFSKCLEIKEKKVFYKNDELSIMNYDSSRFIMAEYIRKRHSERSYDSILNSISMNLPGSPIPRRIIEVLAIICQSHTQTFEKVMQLPFSEVGIDSEDCHPRYIACLLRLGDLLDMDNNRFSEVLLQTLNTIPLDSIQHKEKHLSIKHIRIDKERIEATAVCDKYEIADLTNRWFELLDNEMSNQMKRWNDIIPNSTFGFLPTLGDLIVDLKNYDTIDGKLRPSFKIDPSKSIELLQGAGLYSEPYQSIRELLQNATDATFLRIFAENEIKGIESKKDDLIDYCKDYPIIISISKGLIFGDKIEWHITITDNGLGLSNKDLSYLTTTGSSNKNLEKKRLMDQMPEWMKPSGTFGIGFQSIFLLTDEITLITRKFNKEAVLKAKLFNPAGKNDGTVLLQTLNNVVRKIGTELSFVIIADKDPRIWSINSNQQAASSAVHSYDFVNDDSLDIDVAKIVDEIFKFSNATCIPIILNIDQEIIKLTPDKKNNFVFYSEEKYIEMSIRSSEHQNRTFFRNQLVEKSVGRFNYLSFDVNILGGNAKEILTLNRNEIKSTYFSKLSDDIIEAALLILRENYDSLKSDLKPQASMFIDYYSTDLQKLEWCSNKKYADWENYKFLINQTEESRLVEVVERYDKIVIRYNDQLFNKNTVIYSENKTLIVFTNEMNEFIEFLCLKAIIKLKFVSLNSHEVNGGKNREIILSKNDEGELIIVWCFWFNMYKGSSHYARGLMPCSRKYIKLQLKNDLSIPMAYDRTFYGYHFKYPLMICPYIRKYEQKVFFGSVKSIEVDFHDRLIELAFENRADNLVTKEEIRSTYQSLIQDMEFVVKEVNK